MYERKSAIFLVELEKCRERENPIDPNDEIENRGGKIFSRTVWSKEKRKEGADRFSAHGFSRACEKPKYTSRLDEPSRAYAFSLWDWFPKTVSLEEDICAARNFSRSRTPFSSFGSELNFVSRMENDVYRWETRVPALKVIRILETSTILVYRMRSLVRHTVHFNYHYSYFFNQDLRVDAWHYQ